MKIKVYELTKNHFRGGLKNNCHACGAPRNVPCEHYMKHGEAFKTPSQYIRAQA